MSTVMWGEIIKGIANVLQGLVSRNPAVPAIETPSCKLRAGPGCVYVCLARDSKEHGRFQVCRTEKTCSPAIGKSLPDENKRWALISDRRRYNSMFTVQALHFISVSKSDPISRASESFEQTYEIIQFPCRANVTIS